MDLNPQIREISIDLTAQQTRTIDEEARTVEIAFSSELPYERSWGIEVLDHSSASIDLSRLESGGALLVGHDLSDQVGVIDSVRIDNDKVARATVRFGKSQRAQEIFQDVVDGIRTNVSVGYYINEYKQIGKQGDVPIYMVTHWTPYEISLVTVPADPSVGVGRSIRSITSPSLTKSTSSKENTMNQHQINRNFNDLIDNAQPEQIPTFDKESNFKGFRQAAPSTMSLSINAPLILGDEESKLLESSRSLLRDLTVANSPNITNSKKRNDVTWRHIIINSNVLSKAGMTIDTSGQFEGTPFIAGFNSAVSATWLGENAEIPESTPTTINFPYEIHTIGAFSMVSRRMRKLVPALNSELSIAQANAIREALEVAFLTGDASINPNQPNGLLKSISQSLTPKSNITGTIADVLEVLETKKLGVDSLSTIVSVDVAKKMRLETASRAFKNLDIQNVQVSPHLPNGSLIAGRFADFIGITGNQIEFLAHSFTPDGEPETGATRVRSMFDADCKILNQDSFVKVEGII